MNFPIVEHNPYVDSFFSPNNWTKQKRGSYDLVIDLHNSAHSRKFRFNSRTQIIRTDKMPIRKWLMLLFRINLLNKIHVVSNHIKPLHILGISDDGLGLDLHINSQPSLVEALDGISNKTVINVGGSKITKRIPKSLVKSLTSSSSQVFILVGGEDVFEDYKDFSKDNVINLVHKLKLKETLYVVKECKQLITGDSALMHAAAAFHKKQIVLWGSTSDDFGFYPYYGSKNIDKSIHITKNLNCQPCSKIGKKSCPKGHMRCLMDISAKEVLLSINEK